VHDKIIFNFGKYLITNIVLQHSQIAQRI